MSLNLSLKKSFKDFSLDVSFSMGEDLNVLFGPSGAGKSLILKLISGIEHPDGGLVEIAGAPVFDSSAGINVPVRKRRVGHLFQDYALFPHMSVYDNIAYGVSEQGREARTALVGELLEIMRLKGLDKRFPHELSGGQKQRAALARTLATSPRILLLDEPFSALDYQVREKLRRDLKLIHERFPITIIMVTHDLEEAFMMGSSIAVINDGSVEQFGSSEDVFYRPATRNVARFVGTRNIFSGSVVYSSEHEVRLCSESTGELRVLQVSAEPQRLKEGKKVSFCIRPEEIPVVRKGRAMEHGRGANVLEGRIVSLTGRGTTHSIFVDTGKSILKVELPNFVMRDLDLAEGHDISLLLKKESIWIIP
ncbi:MAG: ABC transporter ATP-binding protein [Thermodesulfobacteriota bacterium]